jgi:prophage antirepressor-like protein
MKGLTKVFNYQSREVRTVVKDGEPWFVAKDVCEILEISKHRDAISRLSEFMRGSVVVDTLGGKQEMAAVSEAGVYKLVFTSRKPEAEKFTDWVASEVIPSIRKTGGYVSDDDLFLETYFPFADETTKAMFRNTLQTVRAQNEIIKKQKKEIEYKENVIVGLVDEVSLAEKRQILNRVVRHNNANYQDRWRELYKQFEMKYHINISQRFNAYNETHKPKLRNKLDYIDIVMNKVPELYEIACKIYENDIKELISEMYILAH